MDSKFIKPDILAILYQILLPKFLLEIMDIKDELRSLFITTISEVKAFLNNNREGNKFK